MKTDSLIDAERLLTLMDYYDLTGVKLAEVSGLSPTVISEILNRKRKKIAPYNLARLAKAVRIPAVDLTFFHDANWRVVSQFDRDKVDELFEIQGHAKVLLAISPRLDNYILPKELHMLVEKPVLEVRYPDPDVLEARVQAHERLWEQRQIARKECNYLLKVITRGRIMDLAKSVNPGWIDDMVTTIRRDWSRTAVGIVPDEGWRNIDRWVRDELGLGSEEWLKINVADSVLLCVYTYSQVFFSFYAPKVIAAKELIEHRFASQIEGPYPGIRIETDTLKQSCKSVVNYIDQHWRCENSDALAIIR